MISIGQNVMNPVIREHIFSSEQILQIAQGDITTETTDAIVNAANRYLEHGAGVAGAIVRKGGSQIQAESRQWVLDHGLVSHDAPAYTHAGNLPCRYVIHAVGPVWGEGEEQAKLESAVYGSLELADELGLGSISLPALSTGIFGFPKALAAQVILSTIDDYLAGRPTSNLQLIRVVLFDDDTVEAFLTVWERYDHLNP
jgi:O-acetyl-ADP-ribose deacetylase (regulator of RNase III)